MVTAEICAACQCWRDLSDGNLRCLETRARSNASGKTVQLVVAKYRENTDWIRRLPEFSPVVYDKLNDCAENALPNRGREAHTYLHHIVSHYHNLADITIFVQGNPFDHVPDFYTKLCKLTDEIGFRDLCDYVAVEDRDGDPIHPGLPTGRFFEQLFGRPCAEHIMFRCAACFAVSKDLILARSREFYQRALELVCSHPLGAHALERLWQFVFQGPPRTQGVVTAADTGFFPDLQFMVQSLRSQNAHSLTVFDLGLTPQQREWINAQPNTTCEPAPPWAKAFRGLSQERWWQTWIKPLYLFLAPYDRVLWIDADCVVLRDLSPAFEALNAQPLLVRDGTGAHTANDRRLYQRLKLPRDVNIHQLSVNAGVIGLCKIRDRALLDTWAYGVSWAAHHPRHRGMFAWADQGVLHWAMGRRRLQAAVRQDLRWNLPVGEQESRNSNLLAAALAHRTSLLGELRARYPEASILHFFGANKLTRILAQELSESMLAAFR